MKIDLHTHSSRSDGTDTPAELVERAVTAGLDIVALTDHDATTGWDEAGTAAERCGITLVRGIEISTMYRGRSVHVLGYEFDPAYEPLVSELARVVAARDERVPRMLARFEELGIPITEAELLAQAEDAVAIGRPHLADALIARGYVKDRAEAFDKYLASGRPGYIDRYSTELFDAVELIGAAGGKAVIAHPWSRDSHEVLDWAVFASLVEHGLAGIEVEHNDHSQQQREELRAIATELKVAWTGSSDYHGTGKVNFELGCNTTEPEQFEALFFGTRLSGRTAVIG